MDRYLKCVSKDELYTVMKCLDAFSKPLKKLHWHLEYEIIYFLRGEGIHNINFNEYEFRSGDFVILSPTDFHKISPWEGSSCDYMRAKIHYHLYKQYLSDIIDLNSFPLSVNINEENRPGLIRLFEIFINEYNKEKSPGKDIMCINLIKQIFIIMRENQKNNIITNSDNRLKEILLYIQNNFNRELTVSEVADAMYYSRNHLSFIFSKHLGITFKEYLMEIRLECASAMLKYTDLPVNEICLKSGFNSPGYFSEAFRRKFGYSPGIYRKINV